MYTMVSFIYGIYIYMFYNFFDFRFILSLCMRIGTLCIYTSSFNGARKGEQNIFSFCWGVSKESVQSCIFHSFGSPPSLEMKI